MAAEDLERYLGSRIKETSQIGWDTDQQAVVARRERRLGELVLTNHPLATPDPGMLRSAMIEGVTTMGLDCLPWTPMLRQWQARVLSLRQWLPEQNWPDLSDARLAATLSEWLEPYLDGVTRREHLRRLDLSAILKNQLEWPLPAQLDSLAPTHLRVPSGSRLKLDYSPGQPPVLAVKLQEMFGLADTPRIADGRVPVTLHLLSPARRPIQVTQDLRGFWERTYADVRKELKGRYPKHPWPDDPWTAAPTRHTKPRR